MLTISEFGNVRTRVQELGLGMPSGLALLPVNFIDAESKSELLDQDHAPTVRTLWRHHGIIDTHFDGAENLPQLAEKAFVEWVAPTIFVSAALMSQNPTLVTVALNVLSNYIYDALRGFPHKRVKVTVVEEIVAVDGDSRFRQVEYTGDPEGLAQLPQVLREVFDDAR